MRFLIAFLASLMFFGSPATVLAQSTDEANSESSPTAPAAEEKAPAADAKSETAEVQPSTADEKKSDKVKSTKKGTRNKQKKQK